MGMMGWGVLLLCYAAKQLQVTGEVSDSMLVSVALMHVYICKFFVCALALRPPACMQGHVQCMPKPVDAAEALILPDPLYLLNKLKQVHRPR